MVITIDSLLGQNLESYATNLFNEYALGTSAENNGVLLLVAMKERKVRIEVGAGINGVISDAKAKVMIEKHFVPKMKAGDYNGAVTDTFNAIKEAFRTYKEISLAPESSVRHTNNIAERPRRKTPFSKGKMIAILYVVFIIAFIGFVGLFSTGNGDNGSSSSDSNWSDSNWSDSGSSDSSWSDSGGYSDGGGASGSW